MSGADSGTNSGAIVGEHEEFHLRQTLSAVLKEGAGLCVPPLDDDKLLARLLAVCAGFRNRPLLTPQELLAHAQGERCNEIFRQAVLEGFLSRNAVFFRDLTAFRFLQERLQEKLQDRSTSSNSVANTPTRPIKVWSAACASGQEPLSLSILFHDLQKRSDISGLDFEIYASDISSRSLEKAKKGLYNNFDAQHGLSIGNLMSYFDEQEGGGFWQAKAFLLSGIKFFQHNLLHSPPSFLPRELDWIFIPHTFDNFDAAVAERVITRLASLLSADGWLVLSPRDAELALRAGFSEDALSCERGLFSRATFSYPDRISAKSLASDSSISPSPSPAFAEN